MTPDISVILATYNRADFLEPCLVSLCGQTLDPSRYEICVVNNACTDATPGVVARIAARFPKHNIFMVREPQPGLSRARNCGLAATNAPLVANIDDDGTVSPDWLERFLARFAELGPEVAIVGGEIEPVWGGPKPDWLTEEMQRYMTAGTGLGDAPRFLVQPECSCECNGCYRRSALAAAGNYPVELGRIGQMLLSGENVVESLIQKNGGKVFFDPGIRLKHYIHADRLTPGWLRRRIFWQGVSGFAVRQYQARHGIPVPAAAELNLPLSPEDWQFVNRDSADNLVKSLNLFQSLGFVLALTGIMPVENA